MELKAGYVCDRGLNPRRPVNQDRYLALVERGLFAVFDGVGGQRAGEVASQTAAETIEEALAYESAAPTPEHVRRAIQFANRDIYEMAEGDPAYKTMATTVALLHFNGDRATIAHVGDSRVYRLEDGRLHCETIDHTDLNDDLRAGRITKTEAADQEERNVINRALGVEPDVEVEIKTIRVRDGARFLLCSDGVYKHLSDPEIARLLAENPDPQRAAEEIKRVVCDRGADDNLTAVVVQVGRARKGAASLAAKARSSEAYGPATAKTRSARAGGGRIQVEFGNTSKDVLTDERASAAEWGAGSKRALSGSPLAADNRSVSRTVMYVMLALVLAAASFYGGLRASDWINGRTSGPPDGGETISSLEAGRAAFDEANYPAAALELDSLVKREPQNAQAHYWLGRARLELGQYASAAESFEQAISIQPTFYDAYVQAAAAYGADGRREKAERMLRLYGDERRKAQR
ncbi:MAG TPA: protein phosphatase 2C domain-containing protein [Blastocatellia bacterium]|nr:protein phosphatase 2C domain-containing protein [Blastocatellia bacterium]